IRYDHRDTGRSTSFPAGAPPYSGPDLAGDALGLLDALGERQAHLVGLSMGGGLAQWIALVEPARVLTLTLMSTSAVQAADSAASADSAGSAESTGPAESAASAADPEPEAGDDEPEVD